MEQIYILCEIQVNQSCNSGLKGGITIEKVVITGATGIIGSALIACLVEKGIRVLALCRKGSKKIENILCSPLVKIEYVDLKELKQMTSDESYDVFYHLGWEGTFGISRNAVYWQQLNIQYTLDAVELAKRLNCHTFIGTGSQAEYGRKEEKLSAHTATTPETGYGIAKYAAGRLSALYAKQLGLKHIWIRVLSVYGPKDGDKTMIMSAINELLEGKVPKFTKGEQMWDYLYVTDAAKAFYLLADKGLDQKVYCLGSGTVRLLRDYIYEIRDNIDKSLEIAIGSIPYNEHQVMYLCADLEDLTKDTGFLPEVTFEEGIKRTIEYCKERKSK